MARQTFNRRVTTLDSGKQTTEATNSPAVESEAARFQQLGGLRRANVAASLAAVQLTPDGVDSDAPTGIVAGRAGEIVGIAYRVNAAISAGGASAAQLQASVAPAATGTPAAKGNLFNVASGGAQNASFDETQGDVTQGPSKGAISFNEGDILGVQLTTSGTFAPTTADLDAWLLIRWTA